MAALPNAPALRVVGRDETQQAEQTRDAARAQAYAPPPSAPPIGLAGFITDQYTLMRRHRDTVGRGWSDRLLAALRAFNGVYEPNIIEEIKKFGGSNVYSRIIAMKCRGTSSLLRDVYIGADRPWSVVPASDPDVPPDIVQAINQLISGEVMAGVQAHFQAQQANQAHQFATQLVHQQAQMQGQHPAFVDQSIPSHASGPSQGGMTGAIPPNAMSPPGGAPMGAQGAGVPGVGMPPPPPVPPLPDPGAVRDRFRSLMEAARDQAKRKAAEQSKITEDKFEQLLAEGGFYEALAEFLVDLPLFPYAVMKGPVVKIKTQVKWSRDVAPWSNDPKRFGGPPGSSTPPQMGGLGGLPGFQAPSGSAGAPLGGGMGGPPGLSGGPGGPGLLPQSNPLSPGANGATAGAAPPPPSQTSLAKAYVEDTPILCWERVSPFDIYWTPGVADIEDANIVQRSRLTRSDLNDLLDLPGFLADEVRAVLDEYGRGGLVDNWDTTDAERAILESREDPRFNQSGLIACLEFQGMAQGRYLLDLGVDPSQIPDPLRDYFCNAWLIGRHIIKVQLSPSPRKRHQYYVTSFEKVPGNCSGNGLPDLLADISSVANATLRAMVNNLSISSGPQVTVNDDRLADGENGEEMYPWKRWHVKADPFGNNTEKAIEFFQPGSNSQELLQVYMQFSNLADEHSAIPKFMTGSPPQGGLGRTASGLSMLMQNSSKILQTVAANIDRDVIEPILTSLYDMVMMTDQTGLLTGEEKVRVLGVQVAQQRETQRARQLEFLQLTANPIDMGIIGPKGRAQVLRNVATEIGLPGENIVPTDDQMDQQQKQAAAQAAQQQMIGHAPPGTPPGQPAAGQGSPPAPGGGPPHTNLVNPSPTGPSSTPPPGPAPGGPPPG